jgi:hypothetical protein
VQWEPMRGSAGGGVRAEDVIGGRSAMETAQRGGGRWRRCVEPSRGREEVGVRWMDKGRGWIRGNGEE